MTRGNRLALLPLLATAALLAVAACGDADPSAGPTPGGALTLPPAPPTTPVAPTSAGADSGPVYVLTGDLCERADLAPLAEVFPTADTPLASSARLCDTSRSSETMTVALSVDAELLPDARFAKEYFDTARRLAKSPPTDLPGAGSGAFWTGDERTVELHSHHGNLVLQVQIHAVHERDRLPEGIPRRLALVAAGTFARLAP